jgi:hypothetical protein
MIFVNISGVILTVHFDSFNTMNKRNVFQLYCQFRKKYIPLNVSEVIHFKQAIDLIFNE